MFTKKRLFLCLLSYSLLLVSCQEEVGCRSDTALNYSPQATVSNGTCLYPSLSLTVNLQWGSLPFEINRIYNLNGDNMAVKVMQCYFSNFDFVFNNPMDTTSSALNFHLLNKSATTIDLGKVPNNHLQALQFNVGVDSIANANIATYLNDMNHPLHVQSPDTMHWNTTDGYIFLKLTGKVDRNGDGIPNENESFEFEIGTNALLQPIELVLNQNFDKEQENISINFDVQRLFDNIDLQSEQSTHSTDSFALAQKIAQNIPQAISY